ncbi:urea ABC transporter ATP-binding protein UrtD [Paenibacillus filicis]|uniref:Urea ABC transporter ATP-binding protein UrtD n=1 Tax=Paenibacillus filicis TaxID=669464 RepID=A0ABU9DN64_9BACL
MHSAEAMPRQATAGPIIRVEQLEVRFGDFKAIRGLNFSLAPGELRFLIGPNGAGKTTLLDVLCGKTKPSSGTVRFKDNWDLAKFQEHQIAQLGIGRKFQSPSIFATLSVLDNMLLALKAQRGLLRTLLAATAAGQRERAIGHLETVGLAHKSGLQAGALSHGEKQWLEIGMLLSQEPELLLLDEPAAGMTDSETEKTGELLVRIGQTQTVIVVEHDMEFVKQFASIVTVMHEGSVLREGTMEEIQADDQVAQVYLGRRTERHDD